MVFTKINKKDWSSINLELFAHSTPEIFENARKKGIFKHIKLEIFNSIETFVFDLQKFDISFMP